MSYVTRFAPSPTGPLHLGHAFSALTAWDRAQARGGRFLLRIEDIDRSRARPHWEAQIYEDLAWLGLRWEEPVVRQSERGAAYHAALNALWERDLLYPCTCTRRDIAAAASAPQEGASQLGPDGLVYPGTCRVAHPSAHGPRPEGQTLRLNMAAAVRAIEPNLAFTETGTAPGHIRFAARDLIDTTGDIVVARQDMAASYHLAVVLDDAEQEVTEVVRGADLFAATQIHVVLQQLLGLPTPIYHHHRLIRDEAGKRLAKRDDARALETYRAAGATPADIRRMVGL